MTYRLDGRRALGRLLGQQRKSTMAKRLFFPISCFLLLLGCAAPYASVMKSYQDAPLCCRSVKEFEFQKLTVGQSVNFEIDVHSKAYLFDTGKSYFKSFELPPYVKPYHIVVASYMLGDHIDSAYIFFPYVMIMDKDYRIVRSIGRETFELKKTGVTETWGLRYKLEGGMDFREENANEKYLIILTTDELLKAKTSLKTMKAVPIILPGIVGAVPVGKEEKLVPHSPAGKITVTVTTSGRTNE